MLKEVVESINKKYYTDVEEVRVELVEDGEPVDMLDIVLYVDDRDIREYGDYGEDEDFKWFYEWDPKDKKSENLIKKYKLEKILSKIFGGLLTPRDFEYLDGEPYAWIDLKDRDWGRI